MSREMGTHSGHPAIYTGVTNLESCFLLYICKLEERRTLEIYDCRSVLRTCMTVSGGKWWITLGWKTTLKPTWTLFQMKTCIKHATTTKTSNNSILLLLPSIKQSLKVCHLATKWYKSSQTISVQNLSSILVYAHVP